MRMVCYAKIPTFILSTMPRLEKYLKQMWQDVSLHQEN
jgi:hypothetical protein